MISAGPLAALYAAIPKVACKEGCSDCCGPINATPDEVRALELASGRKLAHDARLNCSMLEKGRCLGYSARPLICRLMGTVRGALECPHGGKPERWLSNKESYAMLAKAEALGGR
jgi:Fe-S-cluster containining protein